MTERDTTDALAPVREALVRRARADAETAVAAAEAEQARLLADARARAGAILAEASAQGEADAVALHAAELARARRAARSIMLGAQRAVYEELCRRAADEVSRRCADAEVRAALTTRIRRLLGPAAQVVDDPHGGVVGCLDGRRLDYSRDTLAANAVRALGEEVTALWTT